MKKFILILLVAMFSMSAKSEDFRCMVYNLSDQNPVKNAKEADFYIDLYKNEVLLLGPEGGKDRGKVYVENRTDKKYNMTFVGEDGSKGHFSINTDPSIDTLSEYVDQVANDYGLSQAQVQQMRKGLDKIFEGITVNGTQSVLGRVGALMSCEKL